MRIPLVIVGAGGFGREVAWLVSDINAERTTFELLGFVDDSATGTVEGYPVLGTVQSWLATRPAGVKVVCAVGEPSVRAAVVARLAQEGVEFASLIHPSVKMSRWVTVRPGSIICADTILTTNIDVGAHSILSLDCTVGHDTVLREFASLMPGVHVSGEVILEEGVYLGTGVTVINRVRVGAWTLVGAGAVVASDLPPSVIAVGVPAKPIKPNPRAPSIPHTSGR